MKKLAILGSTGSIGRQTLDVVKSFGDQFKITSMACGANIDLFRKQILEFQPELVSVSSKDDMAVLKEILRKDMGANAPDVFHGTQGLIEVAKSDGDILVNGIMGMVGLRPTYEAILSGKDIALANKETLVAGGELVMKAVENHDVKMLPIDSEHSAIFQCLQGFDGPNDKIKRIILTASGGPFRRFSKEELKRVKLQDALKHPNWSMGKKITIDSATLMNKGLEVIEAKWLFQLPLSKIQVHIHPESIVHSGVEFMDGSIVAQMGIADMKVPISYALTYPERGYVSEESLDLFRIGRLTFEKPDREVFKCLDMAYDASSLGGSYPVVLNSANEALVEMFIQGKIKFPDIQNRLERILSDHKKVGISSIDDIEALDREVKEKVWREDW